MGVIEGKVGMGVVVGVGAVVVVMATTNVHRPYSTPAGVVCMRWSHLGLIPMHWRVMRVRGGWVVVVVVVVAAVVVVVVVLVMVQGTLTNLMGCSMRNRTTYTYTSNTNSNSSRIDVIARRWLRPPLPRMR